MVQIEYCVDPQQAEDFLRAKHEVRRMRERNGACGWFLARDPSDVQRHVEAFLAESWLDYLRQLERRYCQLGNVAEHCARIAS